MSTITAPVSITPILSAVHYCQSCGRPAHVTYSHSVGTAHYVYVWCAVCSYGQYQGAVAL